MSTIPDHYQSTKRTSSLTLRYRLAIVLLLGLAVLSSVWCGFSTLPRAAPDEAHHAAVVRYLIQHPTDFPVTYHRIDTSGAPNHLAHPPLYYAIAAAYWRVLHPTSQPSEDEALIPALRPLSWLLVILGAIGVFRVITRFCELGWLRSGYALAFVAIISFVPSLNFIGGVLNNDVMAFVIWPWMILALTDWRTDQHISGFWNTTLWIGAAVLSKATLWPLAFAAFTWLMFDWRALFTWRSAGWPRLAFITLFALAAVIQLSANIIRYGALQPDVAQIYGVAPDQTEFFQGEPIRGVMMPVYVAAAMANDGVVTMRGVITHHEKIMPIWPKPLALLFGFAALWLTITTVRDAFSAFKSPNEVQRFIRFALLTCGVFGVALYGINLATYWTYGSLASMGRYAVAYLPLAALAWCVSLSVTTATSAQQNWPRITALVMIGIVLFSPLFYQRNALYDRAGETWLEEANRELALQGFEPQTPLNRDVYQRPIQLPDALVFDNQASISFPFHEAITSETNEIVLLIKGDEGAKLAILSHKDGQDRLIETITLGQKLQRFNISLPPANPFPTALKIQLTKRIQPGRLPWLSTQWPTFYDPEILGVYYMTGDE